jgi:hypothetical protein
MAGRVRSRASTGVAEDPDDAGYGTFMFFVFLTCVLSVAAMVCVLAVVVAWWMLAVVVAIMLSLTAVVIAVLIGALGTTAESYPDLEEATPPPTVVRPLRPVGVAAHRASTVSHR